MGVFMLAHKGASQEVKCTEMWNIIELRDVLTTAKDIL